ncbi:MAG TPA: tetratricopeptide repeat protein [Gemmatimonadales bacterium]|nr:tetratricopeptide repeat protein [Gemmatimonadales bacterium]
MRPVILLACLVLAWHPVAAQSRSQLDITRYGVVLDHPDVPRVTVHEGVTYLTTAAGPQNLDIYLPPGLKAGETRPAVVFLNAIGDNPGGAKVKSWEIYRSWPRLIAAYGMVGISMDADAGRVQESLRGVFRFLEQKGASHGVDAANIGVYAASANVTGASAYLFGDSAWRGVRAAALYYGQPPAQNLRPDLPVLFIVAEGDAPGGGARLAGLWQKVIEAKAPWRLVFGSRLPHAFDAAEDTDESRRVMIESIEFWKTWLRPVPPRNSPPSQAREVVAATYWNRPAMAAEKLQAWVGSNPDDVEGWLQLGRMRTATREFAAADSAYQTAIRKGASEVDVTGRVGQLRAAEQRWDEAAAQYRKAISLGNDGPFTWSQLGLAEVQRGKYAEGIEAYERALRGGLPPFAQVNAYYNMACAHARLGHADQAFDNLGKAIDAGFTNRRLMQEDEDLAPIRSDARFTALLGRIAG